MKMKRSDEETLAILEVHRANLEEAQDFESYKAAHIAYVTYLIEGTKLNMAHKAATDEFTGGWKVAVKEDTAVEEPTP